MARLRLDPTEVLASITQLSDQSLEGRTLMKAQYASHMSIHCRTVLPRFLDIDPATHYSPFHGRHQIPYMVDQPLEVSINDTEPKSPEGGFHVLYTHGELSSYLVYGG